MTNTLCNGLNNSPTFGGGHDICVVDQANGIVESYTTYVCSLCALDLEKSRFLEDIDAFVNPFAQSGANNYERDAMSAQLQHDTEAWETFDVISKSDERGVDDFAVDARDSELRIFR